MTISLSTGGNLRVTGATAFSTADDTSPATSQGAVLFSAVPSNDSSAVEHYQLFPNNSIIKLDSALLADRDSRGPALNNLNYFNFDSSSDVVQSGQQQPLSQDLLAELLNPKPKESTVASESRIVDTTATAFRSDDYTDVDNASDVGTNYSSTQPTDLFFSSDDTPFGSIGNEDIPLATNVGQSSAHRETTPTGIAPPRQRSDKHEQSQSLNAATLHTRKQSAQPSVSSNGTEVFTTSESKTAFARLLNSLVRFDTSEFLNTDDELTDWLSEQLMLTSVGDDSSDAEADSVTTSYADSNQATHNEERIERLQQAYLKIDYLSTAAATSTILSAQSPEPPEATSIWQQIRFECNPRGPPTSDNISGSDFAQISSQSVQLQQLRYSISPRGPSVVSVN